MTLTSWRNSKVTQEAAAMDPKRWVFQPQLSQDMEPHNLAILTEAMVPDGVVAKDRAAAVALTLHQWNDDPKNANNQLVKKVRPY